MFLKNYWYVAATSDELGESLLARYVLGEPLILFRTVVGKPVAMADSCPHRSLPLSMGKRCGDELQCGYHGLRFNAEGRCTHIPGQVSIPPRARVRSYPVVERWKWIWVWMGDPQHADEATIPDMRSNDDPAWAPTGGRLDIECNYQLLVDNLLDLSHAAFVHPSTIGDINMAETPPTATSTNKEVVLERRILGVKPPPFFASLHGYSDNINRLQRIVFTPPSNIAILSRCVPGNQDLDTFTGGMEYMVLNGITPARAKTTYHFWAVNRNFGLEDRALGKAFHDQSLQTLIEDISILEAQQRRIDEQGGQPDWINVTNDLAGVLARKMIAGLSAPR